MIGKASRRQLALTGTALAMIGALFSALAYGAHAGDLTWFTVAAVLVGRRGGSDLRSRRADQVD